MAYTFEVHDFDSLEQEWESMLNQSSSSSIFLTPTWHKVWWRKMKSIDQELRLIKLMDRDTTLGIAPMLKHNDSITFFGTLGIGFGPYPSDIAAITLKPTFGNKL